ncbi:MAG: DsbE family thiol:disulfide interchange protein [Pseudomonadota bacterium]
MNRVFLILPLSVFLAAAIFFAVGLTRDPSRIPSTLIDRPLPEFELAPIEGYAEGLSTADFQGEVALLNVFGSWCVSCHIEHPFLMELAEHGTIPIYGLNWKDPPGEGTAWLKRFGDPYTLIGEDFEGRVALDLGITGAPETFVVDQTGRVRFKFAGPITPEIWASQFEPLIEELRRS